MKNTTRITRLHSLSGHGAEPVSRLLINIFNVFDSLKPVGEEVATILFMAFESPNDGQTFLRGLRQVFDRANLNRVHCRVGWDEVILSTPKSATRIVLRKEGKNYRVCVDFGPAGSVDRANKIVAAFNSASMAYRIRGTVA